ncbi:MAG: hypothetical protein OXF42_06555 [Candidatus Dadabacteria bacterium]|nr:hypothetical protein [Candidatus Dadabacteria bacterium]
MKFSPYFRRIRNQRPDRRSIKDEWIRRVIDNPIHREIQSNGRIRLWGRVDEVGKILRVVLLEDGETVFNVFFDRGFKIGGYTLHEDFVLFGH